MKKNIVIYSNCHGNCIKGMFQSHPFTKDKYNVSYFNKYEKMFKEASGIPDEHIKQLNVCDILIFTPFDKYYDYEILNKLKTEYLPKDVEIIKLNFYRFKGFWYDCDYKPFIQFVSSDNIKFLFNTLDYYGIHNSFRNFKNCNSKEDIVNKINSIEINEEELNKYFEKHIEIFKKIDEDSDIKMYDFFIENYKKKHLFHDPIHPTNIFLYEVFRKIVLKLNDFELAKEDDTFLNSIDHLNMTHWAQPILPYIKKKYSLNVPEYVNIFYDGKYYPGTGTKMLLSIYDWYYIRLKKENFQNFLNLQNNKSKK